MKKMILPLALLALLLSACGVFGSQTNTAPADNANPGERSLAPLSMVALGIFKLEGTDQAVTAEQAAQLLPLWEVYSTLSQSDTAAQAEVDALAQQLLDSLTDEQMKAIQAMNLTQQDLFALMEEKGLTANLPQASGTRTTGNNGGNGFTFNGIGPGGAGPGGGGGFQGGGFPAGGPPDGGGGGFTDGGGRPNASGTQPAGAPQFRGWNGIPSPLLEGLISFLKEKSSS